MDNDYMIRLVKSKEGEKQPNNINAMLSNKKNPNIINANSPIIKRLREEENKYKNSSQKFLSDDELIELEFKEEADKIRASLGYKTDSINYPVDTNTLSSKTIVAKEYIENDDKCEVVNINTDIVTAHLSSISKILDSNDSNYSVDSSTDVYVENIVDTSIALNSTKRANTDSKALDFNSNLESSVLNDGKDSSVFINKSFKVNDKENSSLNYIFDEDHQTRNTYYELNQKSDFSEDVIYDIKNELVESLQSNSGDKIVSRNLLQDNNKNMTIYLHKNKKIQISDDNSDILDNHNNETIDIKEDNIKINLEVDNSNNDEIKLFNNTAYTLPSSSLLNLPQEQKVDIDDSEIDIKVHNLFSKLKVFKIDGDIVKTYSGPVVTTFEFRPAPNVKVSRIQNLQDDLSMALKATSIRIQAPIPGKDVVGIEIPNNKIQIIYLRELFESREFLDSKANLAIVLGKDVRGNPVVEDLSLLPHLLIAGTTGSGKSVGLNAMILSLLYKNTPKDLRLMMIDPKFLEFGLYEDIPHLLTPIITDPKKAITALSKAVEEMNRRYEMMNKVKVKTIVGYNELAQSQGIDKLPYIVIIIDEFADLMIMGGREAEQYLISLAGKARASGIHLIIATQRPTVNVVTGLIKGNLPSKISYRVGSKIDSKVILDEVGAESLLGKGDMLFSKTNNIIRLHAPYNDEKEIERVVNFIKSQQSVEYDEFFSLEPKEVISSSAPFIPSSDDDYMQKAKEIIIQTQKTSISYIQRSLNIGFNKAAKIVEDLEKEGFLSPPNSKGLREILGN